MLKVINLLKEYNSVAALEIPSLTIEPGETIGLIGNNGAGKTTLFKTILNLIRPSRGKVLIKGENVGQSDEWKKYTGAYLDENFLIDFLTVEEYFQFLGNLNGKTPGEVLDFLSGFNEFLKPEILGNQKLIRELSKGNQKKVGIIGALLNAYELLILDEPFANLDPSSIILLKRILSETIKNKNLATIISSHDLNHVIEVCERTVLLEKGKILIDTETSSTTLSDLEVYFSEQLKNA